MAARTTSDPAAFPARLRALLTRRGLTVYRLAKLSGVSQSTLGRILAGAVLPSWETVLALADALAVSLDELR